MFSAIAKSKTFFLSINCQASPKANSLMLSNLSLCFQPCQCKIQKGKLERTYIIFLAKFSSILLLSGLLFNDRATFRKFRPSRSNPKDSRYREIFFFLFFFEQTNLGFLFLQLDNNVIFTKLLARKTKEPLGTSMKFIMCESK